MALIYLYHPLKLGDTFTSNQVKVTHLACSITFKEVLNGVGEFEFVLPANDKFCSCIYQNCIIGIDNQFYGLVRQMKQNVQRNQNLVTISGTDLKGYLEQRITLYPETAISEGLQGYDAIKGVSTETVVKYFVNNNIVIPTNPKRKIIGFSIAPDQQRGTLNDQYMSRFETLSEVCNKNLEGEKLGYQVAVDIAQSLFQFDIVKGVDHTAQQQQNPRVIFDVNYKSLASLEYFSSFSGYKNTFYASLSKAKSEAETMTCMYPQDNEPESESGERFEQHLNVSANLPQEDVFTQMRQYALKDAASYAAVETITATATQKYRYAVDYNLGDFVTIQARAGIFRYQFVALDVQITSITHNWTASGNIVHELGFGEGKISRFEMLDRKIKNGGL